MLDQALLRPGRFDRRITIDRPNLAGRIATLEVHTRNIKLGEDVDLKKVALATAGCVGADLANIVNEAALRAVRKGRKLVTQEDMLAAFEFVIAGSEKKNSVLTEFEKKLVAYHEVGHAMVAYRQKNAEPVQKSPLCPIPRGSLGYTLLMPEEDKTNLRTRDELMAKIAVSMGGRAAEEVIMHTMTNGASQDIQEATNIARNMVAMYGMSDEFGMMALGSVRSQYLDGGYGLDCAQETAAVMDKAVKEILEKCYADAVKVIEENIDDMHKVVAYLLEKETITGGEMVAILEAAIPRRWRTPTPPRAGATATSVPRAEHHRSARASHFHDEREDRDAAAGRRSTGRSPPHPTRRTARTRKRPRRRPLRRTLPPVTARKRPTTNRPKRRPQASEGVPMRQQTRSWRSRERARCAGGAVPVPRRRAAAGALRLSPARIRLPAARARSAARAINGAAFSPPPFWDCCWGRTKESALLFCFLGYYPLVQPSLDAIGSRAALSRSSGCMSSPSARCTRCSSLCSGSTR